MLKKTFIIILIGLIVSLIYMSAQKKIVPEINMITTSGETLSTKDLLGNVYLINFGQPIVPDVLKRCQAS